MAAKESKEGTIPTVVSAEEEEDQTLDAGARPARTGLPERGSMLGRYVVLRRVGSGGMGVVYAAYDPELDRRVALKLLHSEGSGRRRERLVREAQSMARLSHPNTIAVHDVGTFGDQVFVAMEFIDGVTLRAWLTERTHGWEEILSVLVPAGRGLAAAHRGGLVHRDFKPDNVMLDGAGRARVMDFGLARTATGDSLDSTDSSDSAHERPLTLTAPGSLTGTPAYMAPEQHMGDAADARSDQYSFCVTLYEALSGQRPHTAENFAELVVSVTSGPAPALPKAARVPAWLRSILARGLRRDPAERFGSMDKLLGELERNPGRRRLRIGAGVGLLALLGAAAVGYGAANEQPCQGGDRHLEAVWNDDTRARLREAYRATKLSYADDATDATLAHLDTFAEGWLEGHKNACLDTRVRGEQSEAVLDRRMLCLSRLLQELEAVTDVLERGDVDTVQRATALVGGLGSVAACSDIESLLARLPLPDDPAEQARVIEIDRELYRAWVQGIGGATIEVEPDLVELVAEARALGYAPSLSMALRLLAGNHRLLERADSRAIAAEAVSVAVAAGDDHNAAAGWVALVIDVSQSELRPADVLWLIEMADAAVTRAHDPPRLRAGLQSVKGRALHDVDRFDEAEALMRSALEWALRQDAVGANDIVEAYNQLAVILMAQDQFPDAEAQLNEAMTIAEDAWGHRHPLVGETLANLARAYARTDQLDKSMNAVVRARTIFENAFGPDHRNVASMYNGAGLVQRAQGKNEEAVASMRKALEITMRTSREHHPTIASISNNLGDLLLKTGRVEEAAPHFERAGEVFRTLYGSEDTRTAFNLRDLAYVSEARGKSADADAKLAQALVLADRLGDERTRLAIVFAIGEIQRDRGHPREAARWLRRAVARGERASFDGLSLANSRFSLARAYRAAGEEPARWRPLAQAARDAWSSQPRWYSVEIAKLDRWLEADSPEPEDTSL